MTIKFIDLFGGIGGFRHGLEQTSNSFECVKYIEKDKYAVKSYNEIFNEEHEPTDVTELDAEQIPEHNILCAGFPCQSFSIAGERKGFEDTRGTLFFEIARIAEAKKPEILFLENVKGLLSHDNGRTFGRILETLDELGYYVEWQVLNSKHWGVPQNRERVFIIGHLGGEPRSKIFPLTREDREDSREDGRKGDKVTHPCVSGAIGRGGSSSEYLNSLKSVAKAQGLNTTEDGAAFCIDAHYMKGTSPGDISKGRRTQIVQNHWNQEIRAQGQVSPKLNKKQGGGQLPMVLNNQPRSGDPEKGGTGLLTNSEYSYTVNKSPDFLLDDSFKAMENCFRVYTETAPSQRSERQGLKVVQPCLTPDRVNKRQNGRRMKENNEPMFTLASQDIHGVKSGTQIRKLTPKECWRLQGFPDSSFEAAQKVNSDTQLYKQAGNAVTVNVIDKVGQELVNYFLDDYGTFLEVEA